MSDLTDPGQRVLPPFSDSDTSREAALSVYETAATLRARVFRYLREGPATSDELERSFGRRHQSISPRIWELRKAGLIEDSGERRRTSSGRQAVVWRVRP